MYLHFTMEIINMTLSWRDGINLSEYESSKAPGNGSSIWSSLASATASTIIALTIMIVTVIGNTTLILTIVSKGSRRLKRVNIFLVNLAIGDLFVAFIVMTTEMFFFAFGEWVLGAVVCKLSLYLQIVLLAASTFILTAMSFDRYQVIVNPMLSLATRPTIWKKVVLAWLMAFVFAIPQLFIFVLRESNGKRQCVSQGYTAKWQRKLYFSYLTCYILVIPGITMMFCYSRIIAVIWSRSNDMRGVMTESSPRMTLNRKQVSQSKRKAVVMTLTVILGFIACITPYYIVTHIRIYTDYRIKLSSLNEASKLILVAHSALNPFFYGFFMLKMKHLYCLVPKVCFKHSRFVHKRQQSTGGGSPATCGHNGMTLNVQSAHDIDRRVKIYIKTNPLLLVEETHPVTQLQQTNIEESDNCGCEKDTPSKTDNSVFLAHTETGNVIVTCKDGSQDEVTQYVSSL